MKITRILVAAAITSLLAATPTATPQAPVTPATVHSFAAQIRAGMAPMVEAPDGTLFGVAESGGEGDHGFVFSLAPNPTGGFTFDILYQFNGADGQKPAGLTYSAVDNKLYGTTQWGGVNGPIYDGHGTVFSLTRAGALTTLVDFNLDFNNPQPLQPAAPLLEASDGNFYGTGMGASTNPGSGAIFMVDRFGNYSVLHVFSGADGSGPASKLVEGSDGRLYGTTVFGGSDDAGTVFRLDKGGTVFQTLHHFTGPSPQQPAGLLLDTSGGEDVFYGLTGAGGADGYGSVFRIQASGAFTTVASFPDDGGGNAPNGSYPNGALVKGPDGLLYGTTQSGGPGLLGVVFSVDPATGTLGLVHDFNSDYATGIQSIAGLLRAGDGTLLGTTVNGGAHRVGTVFRVDTSIAPAAVSKAIDFPSLGPAFPTDRLLRASDGHLYGTTASGGLFNSGTIFQLAGGVVTTIHDFNFADGHIPSGELMEGSDGHLYGTTIYGGGIQFPGDFGGGTVFRISKAGAFTMLHAFSNFSVEGASPLAGLVEGPDGNFYGTTHQNGPGGAGTVFKMTPAGDVTTLHSFNVWSATRGTLVIGEDGFFYGVTGEGGANPHGGTIYKIDSQGNFVLLHEFVDPADGARPNGLILGTDGNLYGTTEHGGAGFGTLFRITPAGVLTVLHRFDRDVDGSGPMSAPLEAGDGNLYGSTRFGGRFPPFLSGLGTLYRYDSAGLQRLYTFGAVPFDPGTPFAGLAQGSDNLLYGSTENWPGGTLFSLDQGITNKPPTARGQRVTIGPGETANVTIVASDPDGNPLTFLVVDAPDNGTLSGTGPSFSYVPNPGFSGTDAFRVRVNDGTVSSPVAGVLITVGTPNTVPIANDQSVTTDEDTTAPIALTASDAEGHALTFTVVAPPAHGALSGTAPNLTYTPAPDYNGPDSFTFKVNDGSLDSNVATVSLDVAPVNDAPVAHDVRSVVPVEGPTDITLGATDPDGDALTFSIVTQPAHGVLSGTGPTVTYTSTSSYTGPDSFTFKANDGTVDSNVATASITVTHANRPPVSNPGGPYTGDVGASVTFDGTGSSDPDTADGDSIVFYQWTVAGTIALNGATPTLSSAHVTGLGTGTFAVDLLVTDGRGLTHSASTTLTVRAPAASFTAGPNPAACSQAITFDASASANTRPGRTIVFYTWAFGDATTGSGQTVMHAYAAYGTYQVTLTVTDDLGITATSSVSVDISQGNQPPVARHGGPYFTYPGRGVDFNGSASSDPNESCGDNVVNAVWVINGTITWFGMFPSVTDAQIASLGPGTFPVELTVTDEFGASSTASTTLTIGGPVSSFTVVPNPAACGQNLTFDASASRSTRPDRTIVAYDWDFGDGSGLGGANPMPIHAYSPYGSYTATLTVVDDAGMRATSSVIVTVNQGNQPPVVNAGGPYVTNTANPGITLEGNAIDPNLSCGDSIVSYQWLVNGTLVLAGRTPALSAAQIAGLGAGTFPVQITVTDMFGAATTAATTLTVLETTTRILQASVLTVGALESFRLTAQVLPLPTGSGIPQGNVEFVANGTTVLGVIPLSNGAAPLDTNGGLIAGTYSIVARYPGDGTYPPSVSPPVSLTVRPLAESSFTLLIPWTNPVALGSPAAVSAAVVPLGGAGITPTGTVRFLSGSTVIGSATIAGGLATLVWTPAATGTLTLRAEYLGDAALAASTSQPGLITVYSGAIPTSTTTTIAITPSPATLGQPVTLTATVTGAVAPGGVVTFFVDGMAVGTGPVTSVGGSLRATFTTSTLLTGVRIVSASYGGIPGSAASNSAPVAVVINP